MPGNNIFMELNEWINNLEEGWGGWRKVKLYKTNHTWTDRQRRE